MKREMLAILKISNEYRIFTGEDIYHVHSPIHQQVMDILLKGNRSRNYASTNPAATAIKGIIKTIDE